MVEQKYPDHYLNLKKRHPKFLEAIETLGRTIKREGPIEEKCANLIQIAAATCLRSEGSVHSHTRRAIEAGATADEIYHALILITSIAGFATVAAGLCWVDDILMDDKKNSRGMGT